MAIMYLMLNTGHVLRQSLLYLIDQDNCGRSHVPETTGIPHTLVAQQPI